MFLVEFIFWSGSLRSSDTRNRLWSLTHWQGKKVQKLGLSCEKFPHYQRSCALFWLFYIYFCLLEWFVLFPWIPETVCGHWLRTRFINFFTAPSASSVNPMIRLTAIVIVHGASELRGKIHCVPSCSEMALLTMSTFLLFFLFFGIQTNTCLQRVACGSSVLVSLQNNYQLTSWPSKGQEQGYKCSYKMISQKLLENIMHWSTSMLNYMGKSQKK